MITLHLLQDSHVSQPPRPVVRMPVIKLDESGELETIGRYCAKIFPLYSSSRHRSRLIMGLTVQNDENKRLGIAKLDPVFVAEGSVVAVLHVNSTGQMSWRVCVVSLVSIPKRSAPKSAVSTSSKKSSASKPSIDMTQHLMGKHLPSSMFDERQVCCLLVLLLCLLIDSFVISH